MGMACWLFEKTKFAKLNPPDGDNWTRRPIFILLIALSGILFFGAIESFPRLKSVSFFFYFFSPAYVISILFLFLFQEKFALAELYFFDRLFAVLTGSIMIGGLISTLALFAYGFFEAI